VYKFAVQQKSLAKNNEASAYALSREERQLLPAGSFPDFRSAQMWRPITVAGPWPIFTAFLASRMFGGLYPFAG
jgi:hypothetical protein